MRKYLTQKSFASMGSNAPCKWLKVVTYTLQLCAAYSARQGNYLMGLISPAIRHKRG